MSKYFLFGIGSGMLIWGNTYGLSIFPKNLPFCIIGGFLFGFFGGSIADEKGWF